MKTLNLRTSLMVASLFLTPTVYASDLSVLNVGDRISVTGNSAIEVDPDMATIQMSSVSRAKTAAEAQADNARKINGLTQSLTESFQMTKDQIKTTGYSVSPDYNNDNLFVGYIVRHSVSVFVSDIAKVGDILDMAGAQGADEIGAVSFGLTNEKTYELQALKLAMNDAKDKAEAIAQAAGRNLARIVQVSESNYYVHSKSINAVDRLAGTMVFPGQVSVTATVSVDYEF